jgi:hypothetical protein
VRLQRYTGLLAIVLLLTGCMPSSQDRTSSSAKPDSGSIQSTEQSRPVLPVGTPDATTHPGTGIEKRDRQAGVPSLLPPVRKEGGSKIRVLSDEDTGLVKPLSVERITGYRTPAEYLTLSSKYVADATTVVTLPRDYEAHRNKRYPLVIVFGGAGECAKPPRSGAMAWMHYYKVDEAVEAVQAGHLHKPAFRGLATDYQINAFNARLSKHPYRGIILACPYSPLLTAVQDLESLDYENYLVRELIPALKARYRVAEGRVGVDGVSMGGARSMYYGLKYPEVFTSIGSIQGAFGPYFEVYERLIRQNGSILRKHSIQLVTSDGDVLQHSVHRMHQLLLKHGIPHRYYVLTGPHDYIFNQGPGSLALLVFHNEALNKRIVGPVR